MNLAIWYLSMSAKRRLAYALVLTAVAAALAPDVLLKDGGVIIDPGCDVAR